MAHTHYKGTGKVHSFRGLLVNEGQDRIRIQGPVGAIAWRITKFQVMPINANETTETVVKIYRETQSSVTTAVDFNEEDLLGAAIINDSTDPGQPPAGIVIFDNALFSRNIYVTQKGHDATPNINYYIELEEVKVSAAGMAQLAVAAARRTIG